MTHAVETDTYAAHILLYFLSHFFFFGFAFVFFHFQSLKKKPRWSSLVPFPFLVSLALGQEQELVGETVLRLPQADLHRGSKARSLSLPSTILQTRPCCGNRVPALEVPNSHTAHANVALRAPGLCHASR